MKLKGFLRPNGKIGFRNHFLVVPTVICATRTAEEIASNFPNVVYLHSQHGCNHMKDDEKKVVNVLKGMASNPNVTGVLFVGIGCETIPTMKIFESVRAAGKPVECLIIQEEGGTLKTIEKGVRILQRMMEQYEIKEVETDLSSVTVAIDCGGSDTTSGIASNPVVGYVADRLVDLGATLVFSETTEIIGAEHLLIKRTVNEEVAKKLLELVSRWEQSALAGSEDIRGVNPTPGNITGGLTTLEEKSLGAIYKAGTKPLKGVLEYAEPIPTGGLYFMDSPGHDVESVSGMVAGGAQVVIFMKGRGTPTGCAIAPVIKVTANAKTYRWM